MHYPGLDSSEWVEIFSEYRTPGGFWNLARCKGRGPTGPFLCPIRELIAHTDRAWILAKIGWIVRLTLYQLMFGPNWTGCF